MIEICVSTLFSESPAKWQLRDRVFAKAALEFTNTGPLITCQFSPGVILAQNFEVKQEQVK
jgi:hypothetical protein